MGTPAEALTVLVLVGAIVGFSGGLTGEVLYAARLLSELRKAKEPDSVLDSPWVSLSLGWIASMRANRFRPALRDLAKTNPIVARDLPRFIVCRRTRQIAFVVVAIAIVFLR